MECVVSANNLIFEVAYAGSKITHVGIPDTNINQLSESQLALGAPLLQLAGEKSLVKLRDSFELVIPLAL